MKPQESRLSARPSSSGHPAADVPRRSHPGGPIAYISAEQRDGFRINKALRESRGLIFLSQHIAPSPGMNEADPVVRYFMFVCLHETVHAIKQHRPPNEITKEENEAQEAEADRLALQWFNAYLEKQGHPDMPPLTEEEIQRAQARNQELMKSLGAGLLSGHAKPKKRPRPSGSDG